MTKIVGDDGSNTAEVPVDIDVRAAVSSIFDGHDFSDEFKEKLATMVTGLIDAESNKRVSHFKESHEAETKALMDEMSKAFEDEQKTFVENLNQDMAERVDAYLSYTADNWLEENKIALESGLRVQIAEELIKTMSGVLAESSIILDPARVDAVGRLEEEVRDLEERTTKLIRENRELSKSVISERLKNVVEANISDLTESQKEKMRPILEGCDSEDEVVSKVKTFKESVTATPAKSTLLSEDFSLSTQVIVEDEIKSPVDSINSLAKMI